MALGPPRQVRAGAGGLAGAAGGLRAARARAPRRGGGARRAQATARRHRPLRAAPPRPRLRRGRARDRWIGVGRCAPYWKALSSLRSPLFLFRRNGLAALAFRRAEGAGFEPAADITASDRFQGGSD